MEEFRGSGSWKEELASLVDDEIRYTNDPFAPLDDTKQTRFDFDNYFDPDPVQPENLEDQVKGFVKAWGELLMDLSKGCKEIVRQSLVDEDSYIVKKFGGPVGKVSGKLRFLNEYLPEDRDPVHAWPVIFFVFLLALAALNVNTTHDSSAPRIKKMHIHPPSASRVQLPDGRNMAYHDQGMLADEARFTLIAPHAFLSSRLAGIPGIKVSLLEEFGVRLITYDLPGFGESDPHPRRDLNSSAMDMLCLANALGATDKFWVLGYSTASIHVWAALRYIPDRVAGAIFVAPMVNPYERSMTKEEMSETWEKWEQRRKVMFFLAKRFPRFLSRSYRQCFLSGKHGQIEKWLSLSLGEKDRAVVQSENFEDHWHRDVEESVRQGRAEPFIEEAVLQVSDWGFMLADLQVRKRCTGKGILPWFKSIYSQAECEQTGFPGSIHIWQGMEDRVVPPSMARYVNRVLPGATLRFLQDEGHFSYFYFCDECHREMLSTLFGDPQGPLHTNTDDTHHTSLDDTPEEEVDLLSDEVH